MLRRAVQADQVSGIGHVGIGRLLLPKQLVKIGHLEGAGSAPALWGLSPAAQLEVTDRPLPKWNGENECVFRCTTGQIDITNET